MEYESEEIISVTLFSRILLLKAELKEVMVGFERDRMILKAV
jgi:hypothetical protein